MKSKYLQLLLSITGVLNWWRMVHDKLFYWATRFLLHFRKKLIYEYLKKDAILKITSMLI